MTKVRVTYLTNKVRMECKTVLFVKDSSDTQHITNILNAQMTNITTPELIGIQVTNILDISIIPT